MLTRLIEWTEEVQEKVEKDNKVNLQEFTFKKSHIPHLDVRWLNSSEEVG